MFNYKSITIEFFIDVSGEKNMLCQTEDIEHHENEWLLVDNKEGEGAHKTTYWPTDVFSTDPSGNYIDR
jgi:hypothetical protein